MKQVLYVAAKAPRPGLAKTRLGARIGDPAAVALYRAFLADLAARFAAAPFPVGWYVTPPDAWPELAPIVGPAERWAGVLEQPAGDWTERQRALFRGAPARGEEKTVLIASDSPHLEILTVLAAFDALDRHEVVLGPVHDGGYYLIGMRSQHDVLAGVEMGTATVAEQLAANAEAAGVRLGWLEPLFDVDEADDLAHLPALVAARGDLAATRAALETLGLAGTTVGIGETR